jgi:gliding motility-associated-like protein
VSQSNPYGCESPKARVIAIVHPTPKIVSSSYTNPTSCGLPSGSIVLNVLDIADNPIPDQPLVVHYNRFQISYAIATSTDANGTITIPLTAGNYSGIYVEIHGCTSQPLPNVFVLRDPTPPEQPVAGYNPPLCSGTALNLTAVTPTSSQGGAINYVWAGPAFGPLGDTTTSTLVSFPSASITDAGTYVVYAIQNNCISLASTFQVIIKQSPTKPIISANTPLCIGSSLTLQAHSSIPVSDPTLNYVWTGPGRGFPVSSANAGINSVVIADAGVYAVSVTSPLTGCSSVSDTLIEIGGYPIIKFPTDTLTVATGQILNLSPVTMNAADPNILPMKKYEWSPVQDIVCNDPICSSVTATVKNNECYTVTATNIYGCSDTTAICIRAFCQGSQVFIPNAFTPDGDGYNDVLMVRASGIALVKSFRIFNRWGEVVFERGNFQPNDAQYGWDGKIRGKVSGPDVFVYTADVVCENGSSYTYKGNVSILK